MNARLETTVLLWLKDDWCEPWIIVRAVEDLGIPSSTSNEIARLVMIAYLRLGYVQLGTISAGEFAEYDGGVDAAVALVLAEWTAPWDTPNIGDVGLFNLTPLGQRRLGELRARDCIDYEQEHGFIRVRLRLTSTQDGGRKRPVLSYYWVSWDIGNRSKDEWTVNDAQLVFEDVDVLHPGDVATARIHPKAREFWAAVEPGSEIYAHEGARRIGTAVVLDVVKPYIEPS